MYVERVKPVVVVGWASGWTFLAWVGWDYWMGREGREKDQRVGADGREGKEASGEDGGVEEDAEEPPTPGHSPYPPNVDPTSSLSPRNQQRLATARSTLIIVVALLGLSPILKSLTRSTTSDSIWAMSTWLLFMNVAFFDYSSRSGAQ